jgi:hypothetical protein
MEFATGGLSHAMTKLKKGSSTNCGDVSSRRSQDRKNAKRMQRIGKLRQTLTAPNKKLNNVSRRRKRLIKKEMHSAKRCQRMSEKAALQNQKPSEICT